MSNPIRFFAVAALAVSSVATAHAQDAGQVSPEQVQQLIDTLKQRNEQVRDLSEQLRDARARLAEVETLRARLATAEKALAIAAARNAELVEIGEAILTDYEKMDLGKRAAAGEPLTQLYRVRLENKLQQFRDQIAQLGFYPEKELEALKPAAPAGQPQP